MLELAVLDGLGLLLGLLGSWCGGGGIGLSSRGLSGGLLCRLGGYKRIVSKACRWSHLRVIRKTVRWCRIPAGAVSSLAASTGASAAGAVVVSAVVVAGVSSAGTATGFCSSAIVIFVWGVDGRKLGISKNQKLEKEQKKTGWVRLDGRYRESLTDICLKLKGIDIPFVAGWKIPRRREGS